MKILLMILFIVILLSVVYKFYNRRERFRRKLIQLNKENKKRSYR